MCIRDRSQTGGEILQSESMGQAMLRLRKFMFQNVYLGEKARAEHERVNRALRILFDHYMARPEEVPVFDPKAGDLQRVTDLLAGMTDRYAISHFTDLYVPERSRL